MVGSVLSMMKKMNVSPKTLYVGYKLYEMGVDPNDSGFDVLCNRILEAELSTGDQLDDMIAAAGKVIKDGKLSLGEIGVQHIVEEIVYAKSGRDIECCKESC